MHSVYLSAGLQLQDNGPWIVVESWVPVPTSTCAIRIEVSAHLHSSVLSLTACNVEMETSSLRYLFDILFSSLDESSSCLSLCLSTWYRISIVPSFILDGGGHNGENQRPGAEAPKQSVHSDVTRKSPAHWIVLDIMLVRGNRIDKKLLLLLLLFVVN